MLNDEDYVEAIIDRGNRENNQSHKLNYVRFYDDKTFGLNTEDKFSPKKPIFQKMCNSSNLSKIWHYASAKEFCKKYRNILYNKKCFMWLPKAMFK